MGKDFKFPHWGEKQWQFFQKWGDSKHNSRLLQPGLRVDIKATNDSDRFEYLLSGPQGEEIGLFELQKTGDSWPSGGG